MAVRIDAHQHYWKLERGDYGWLTPEFGPIYRDFLPADLKPILARHGIDKTIAVQAAPTVAETEYLLELASAEPTIAGVVGWVDMEADDFEKQLDRLRQNPKFVGIRPMIQDIEDEGWILRPKVRRSLAALEERGFPLDFLTLPRHLPCVLEVLDGHPNLRAIIDHLSKPPIKAGTTHPWADLIRRVGDHPNVMCKLSGMVTEADRKNWTADDLKPYVAHAFDVFGPDRVVFGSDWPVCLLAATYDQVVESLRRALGDRLTPELEPKLFGENAARFYGV